MSIPISASVLAPATACRPGSAPLMALVNPRPRHDRVVGTRPLAPRFIP